MMYQNMPMVSVGSLTSMILVMFFHYCSLTRNKLEKASTVPSKASLFRVSLQVSF